MKTRSVVLHSGGLDSAVCMLLALERDREVISLGVDYGQKHSVELTYAQRQCERFAVERRVVGVRWDKPTRPIPVRRPISEMSASVSPAFLPGRNIVFLSLACAEAAGLNATEVWIGVNSVDFSGYPDCTAEFVDAYRAAVRAGMQPGPAIVAPLQSMSKKEIAKEAYRLGLRPGDTWSCYQPQPTADGVRPCGVCDACRLHEHAWAEALTEEPQATEG
jgi:7-cyano-7-deazaguanine synthase